MTDQMLSRFVAARRAYIASQFSNLNPMQQEAVLTTDGPLLLLAGAGSGKTTVLINRIANLIRFGSASDSNLVPDTVTEEDVLFLESLRQPISDTDRVRADFLCALNPVAPWSIIAITFTNKAANELKDRLTAMLGPQGQDVWAMTFHSACCRILRKHGEILGFSNHFSIYDKEDSERLIKEIKSELNIDDNFMSSKSVISTIHNRKNANISPEEMLSIAISSNDYSGKLIATVYQKYQQRLKEADAMDFDDILIYCVRLLRDNSSIRDYYQNKFKHVLVDEYQDTNRVQYQLTSLLAGKWENLCVVGDDDQSIYRFRGATIRNILDFEEQYPKSNVIRLEQNYRSTQTILDAANSVIVNNLARKRKRLWTTNGEGTPVVVYQASDEKDEARYIAQTIQSMKDKGKAAYRDFAILYRNNVQSRAFEEAFRERWMPFRSFGGDRFYDRAEVKDMLAYLSVINNRNDTLRLKRIINTPARGIGKKSIEAVERIANAENASFYSIISDVNSYGPLEKSAKKYEQFCGMIEGLAEKLNDGMNLVEFYNEVIVRSGYLAMLEKKDPIEAKNKIENIYELGSSIRGYLEIATNPTLAGFLEEIALYADIDEYSSNEDTIALMTMHASKGQEFPHVFLVGFEDGLFPGMRAIGDHEEMEEERRLCYVAITRAKQTLTISHARQRMLYGRTNAAIASRFLREIPEELIEKKGGYNAAPRYNAIDTQQARAWNDYSAYKPKPPQPSYSVSSTQKTTYLELNKGDMVHHAGFGKGMVLSVMKMGGDALLEIAFDQIGTKKLMAKTASQHMKKL